MKGKEKETTGQGSEGELFTSGIFVKKTVGKRHALTDKESTGVLAVVLALLSAHGICIDTGRGFSVAAFVALSEMGKGGKEVQVVFSAMKPRPVKVFRPTPPGKQKGRSGLRTGKTGPQKNPNKRCTQKAGRKRA